MIKIIATVGLLMAAVSGASAHHPHHHGPHGSGCGTIHIGPHECIDDVHIYLVDNN